MVVEGEVATPDGGAVRVAVRRRLAELEESGALAGDPDGAERIRALLDRARDLPPLAGERLESRAADLLDALGCRLEAERERVGALVADLDAEGRDPTGRLAAAFESGDWLAVRRAARRARASAGTVEAAPTAAEDRLAADLRADLQDGAARYRDELVSLARSRRVAVVEPTDEDGAGVLNGRVLAERLLDRLESEAPEYTRGLVSGLLDLVPLLSLPPVPLPRRRVG